jgi:hypothetical protein
LLLELERDWEELLLLSELWLELLASFLERARLSPRDPIVIADRSLRTNLAISSVAESEETIASATPSSPPVTTVKR